MRLMALPRFASLGVALACFASVGCQTDWVALQNAPSSGEFGLLVDGHDGSSPVNDDSHVTTSPLRAVGELTATTAAPGEVVAFTNGRPVALLENAPWTNNDGDVANVSFNTKIFIPVTVWIVKGPFDTQRQRAIDACVTTSAIWNSERMGMGFSPFQIIDATGDADASTYFDFDCTMQAGLQNDIGETAGRINIYYVDTVDGGTGRGQACSIGSDFVAMGKSTNDELLVHELGHNFGLLHTNGQATFDQTNIMHSASSTRQFITEGQLFRAHLLPTSAINDTYNARPGLPTRTCGHNAASQQCPAINKRLWSDGTFGPN